MRTRAVMLAVLLAALAALPAPFSTREPTPEPGVRGDSSTRGASRRVGDLRGFIEGDPRGFSGDLHYFQRHAVVVGVDHYGNGPSAFAGRADSKKLKPILLFVKLTSGLTDCLSPVFRFLGEIGRVVRGNLLPKEARDDNQVVGGVRHIRHRGSRQRDIRAGR